jgi:hypothetical protein
VNVGRIIQCQGLRGTHADSNGERDRHGDRHDGQKDTNVHGITLARLAVHG